MVLLKLRGRAVKQFDSRQTAKGSVAVVHIIVSIIRPPSRKLSLKRSPSYILLLCSTRKTGIMTQPMPTNKFVTNRAPSIPYFPKRKWDR